MKERSIFMKKKTISQKLAENIPILSTEEKKLVWKKIELSFPQYQNQTVPLLFLLNLKTYKSMTALIILLTLAISGGATALASDSARPGDFLFPLDRAIENVHLGVTFSPTAKEALVKKITTERFQELRSIISEEVEVLPSNILAESDLGSVEDSNTPLLITASVFMDTTIVKMEQDEKLFYFETSATTTSNLLKVIQEKFPMLTAEQINTSLTLKNESRESLPSDKGITSLSDKGEKRINHAVEQFLHFIDKVNINGSDNEELLKQLTNKIKDANNKTEVRQDEDGIKLGSIEDEYEIKINNNGDSKIEMRADGDELKVEEKDDEVSIRNTSLIETDQEEIISQIASTTVTDFEIKAKVFTDQTVIKFKFNDDEVSFTTVADNELDIISKIKEQFPLLTTEQITAKLQLQFKDEKSQGIDSNVEDINREEITNTDVLFDDKNELSDDDDKKSEAEDDDTNQEYANPNENQERLIIDVTKRSQDKSHNQDNEDNKDDNDEGEGDDNNN